MSLIPDPVWADTINQVIIRMASGVRATGRAESWGIDWPNNPLSFSEPFNNRTNNLSVVAEIVNARGNVIGRQTVNIPAGFDIHSRISRNVIPRQWEGYAVFPGVDVNQITEQLGIRVSSIDGVPRADATRQRGITVMSNVEFFNATGIRKVPTDMTNFVVQDDGTLIRYYGRGTEVSIPSMVNGVRVTAIGNGVFQGRGLTSITIPNSVTSIGNNAFANNQLIDVTIPNSVAIIGNYAFSNNQLRNVGISDSVTSIGTSAFRQNQLATVTIPNSITVIGGWAFSNNRLTDVIIPSSVTAIGNGAFANTQITSITMGAYVDIGNIFWLFPGDSFHRAYTQSGRRAGTFTRSGPDWGPTWTFAPR